MMRWTSMSKFALFPHQQEAINHMRDFYRDINISFSGIVSIPTGGGKTFIAVQWILSELEKSNCKIIWLAQSFELLNQAHITFIENSDIKEIKVISSHPDHCNISDITGQEKIIFLTTQTAIRAVKNQKNGLSNFISSNQDNRFIVVLDEAHHAPAYGCRNLLLTFKQNLKHLWLLGLTATPTYTDIKRRGWLWEIFDGGIVYQVEKLLLQRQRILAKENIIRKKTPMKIEVSDEVFNALVKQHRDIPENIIEQIACNVERNNFIINDYLFNKERYGKTIIFLDRWFQCLYFKQKLCDCGVRSDAIFYQNNRESTVESTYSNKQIIDNFRNGNLDVLLNVKMLIEGSDVPDVRTVFITRDTTSHILLQQMIGRALRGERAGGKKEIANIVLFGDNWDKTIAWAIPEGEGTIDADRIKQKSVPAEQISINLIERLVKALTFETFPTQHFLDMIPVGWYSTEYVVFEEGMETIELIHETVLVYTDTQKSYEEFLEEKKEIENNENWAQEDINEAFIDIEVEEMMEKHFKNILSSMNLEIRRGIVAICRHIAQNHTLPQFFSFENRDSCDLEKVTNRLFNLSPRLQYHELLREYNCTGTIWKTIYPTFYHFKTASDMYINKRLFATNESDIGLLEHCSKTPEIFSAEEKVQIQAVKSRDNNTCNRCGLSSKDTKLDVDYILPVELFGGIAQMSNMQALCSRCKRINLSMHINYTAHTSPLQEFIPFIGDEFDKKFEKNITRIKSALKASINTTYHCNAVFDILCSRRKNSPHYSTWTILLYDGNDPMWFQQQKKTILAYIEKVLNQSHVKDVEIQVLM